MANKLRLQCIVQDKGIRYKPTIWEVQASKCKVKLELQTLVKRNVRQSTTIVRFVGKQVSCDLCTNRYEYDGEAGGRDISYH